MFETKLEDCTYDNFKKTSQSILKMISDRMGRQFLELMEKNKPNLLEPTIFAGKLDINEVNKGWE